MRKFTLFFMSLFLMLGTAMAQNTAVEGLIAGLKNVPESTIAPANISTGYYLLKQTNAGAASSGALGYIKADSEVANSSVSIATAAPTANADNEATYIWFIEKNDDGSITIATANKKAYWQAPYKGEKKLGASATSLGIVTGSVTLGGHTATTTDGTAMISNNNPADLALVHYSGGKLGSWNDANPASVWFVEFTPISIDDLIVKESVTIKYNYVFEGATIYSAENTVIAGEAYPEHQLPTLPYGVAVAAKPEGVVGDSNETIDIELSVAKTLPFEAVAEGEPAKWYYAQIHGNNLSYMTNPGAGAEMPWKINGEIITTVDEANADNYTWGFVGNLWTGFKMVSKAGGAIKSTGSGNVTIVENIDEATSFIAMAPATSNNAAAEVGFCLLNAEAGQYMNAQEVGINHWTANDAGSTIVVTEREITVEPEPEVTVEIDATKEYYLKSSWNYGMNSGYLALGDKSGANYGHAYMANDNSQAFKFTLVEDGANKYYTLSTEVTGTMSYTVYIDCSHAYNVNSNAMGGSNLLLELENATSSKYVVKTANGYLKADMVSYGTDGSAYHVFSNGDRESALVFELVEKADAPEVAAPVITEIIPANGAEVTSLSEIVITFDKTIKAVDTMNGIIKVKTTGSTSRAYGHDATISDDGLTVTFPIGDDMNGFKTIDAEGEYTIEIPAGVVTSTDGAKNEAATYTFTIAVPVVKPEVTVEIDATKEYYLKSSWNYGMNSGYLALGDKSGANYGHAYMANDNSQAFKFTLVEDGANKYYTLSTEVTGTMSYTVYIDCSHAYNVNSNAMGGSNLLLELENATSSKYVVKTANGYLKADMVSYGTDGSAYHVFSNGDRESALVFELVEKADAPEVAAPVITEIIPANGAEVTSLSEIVITFDKTIKAVDTMNGIIKVKTTGSTSRAYGHDATISDDGLTVTFPIGDDMNGFKTIDAEGEYTIEIPAGVVTSMDGAKNEAATYTFTIAGSIKDDNPLNVVAVTPAKDEVVNSLREITIEFDAEIAVKELSGTERISIQYLGISNILIGTTATVEGNTLKLVVDSEIKDSGKHTLVIPAGVVTRVSDGVAYEGGTFTFTVEKAAVVVEPLKVVAVTPAEPVETLEKITIEFSDYISIPMTALEKFVIADADGNTVVEIEPWEAAIDGKVVTLTLKEPITAAGEYTFSFAEGLVSRNDGATCAHTCKITVTGATGIEGINGEAGDSVIYDITGRKIEQITKGGIYIVNGKKVLVK